MKFYKKQNDHSIFYENDEGLVFKEDGKDETYHIFQSMLGKGEAEIIDYSGSEKESEDNLKSEKAWAQKELHKIREEAIEKIIEGDASLKSYRDSVVNHKDNPSLNRPQR